jgi:phospholipid transport system substrate-binding protein
VRAGVEANARGHRMKSSVAVVVMALVLAAGRPALAGSPTDQLRATTDRIVMLLEDPALKGPDQADERHQRIRAVASEAFDWPETARRVLGPHWSERTPAEREEFVGLFVDFIERTYVGKLDRYSGEQVLYLGEVTEGDRATVRTKLRTRSSTEVPVDYRMLRDGERWRVYDVLIEGVSLVSSYRTQFSRIIRQSGYPELIRRLREKQTDSESGGRPGKPS